MLPLQDAFQADLILIVKSGGEPEFVKQRGDDDVTAYTLRRVADGLDGRTTA